MVSLTEINDLLLSQNIFYVKFLIFLLLIVIIYSALEKVPSAVFKSNRGLRIIISLAISLISANYMSEENIARFILIPYSSLGLMIMLALPLIIIILVIHKAKLTGVGRKITLIIFGAIVTASWINNLKETSSIESKIYIGEIIAVVILIMLDKQVNKLLRKRMKP